MITEKVFDIWSPDTGIQDLPVDLAPLAVSSVADLRREWGQRKAELGDSDRLRLFSEQLAREWAIETGVIENLYDIERGVTQTLIEQGFQAALLEHGSTNKDRDYVLALIEDQKAALENLFAFVKQDRPLTTGYIKELHAMMTQSQHTTEAFTPTGEKIEVELIKGEWKREPNYPFRDGVQYRYCPPEQTASEMDRLVEMHQRHLDQNVPPEVEAAWLHHRFTQIHPFQDGNGRVARALASLVLIRSGLFPLVVPRDEKTVYLESLERADAGSLRSLVLLVARRLEVAHRRAQNLLHKLAPEGDTLADAASMLGTAYANRQDVLAPRLAKKIEDLHSWIYPELQNQANTATAQLRKAAGIPDVSGGGFGGGRGGGVANDNPGLTVQGASSKDQYLASVRAVLTDRWAVIPSPPCDAFRIIVRVGQEFHLLVHLHALNPETDDAVQVAGLLELSGTFQALDVEPLVWTPGESSGAFQPHVSKWVDQFLRVGLTAIRRHM